jgi:hypothetical protein
MFSTTTTTKEPLRDLCFINPKDATAKGAALTLVLSVYRLLLQAAQLVVSSHSALKLSSKQHATSAFSACLKTRLTGVPTRVDTTRRGIAHSVLILNRPVSAHAIQAIQRFKLQAQLTFRHERAPSLRRCW